jgi:hypothetical protein
MSATNRNRPLKMLLGTALAIVLFLGDGACRDQQSFVVVNVQSAQDTPISGVVELVVVVTNAGSTTELTYPVPADQSPLTITDNLDPKTGLPLAKTFSVSFSTGRTDSAMFHVSARDGHCTVGAGENSQIIKRGGVTNVLVALQHTDGPCDTPDAGDDDAGVVFPGCDPAALSCSAGLTCAVNCQALQGQCVLAGTTMQGGLCDQHGNADCAPGTQCFTYSGPTCNVPACLKFCKTNSDCGPAGSGSVCQGNVSCPTDGGSLATAYHTCTFACDPRGVATTGCPANLHCFLVDTMDQVDCACTEATRTHIEGQACTRGVDCMPGLICDLSTSKCQKICRRSDNGSDCGGKSCVALTSDQIYGICL